MSRFLELAKGVALTSNCRQRHGAIVVRHGRILGAAPNIMKNSPKFVDWRFSSVHAEVRAMRRAGFPKKATVYVARINNFGESRLSKPCASCQEVLDAFHCKVVYTV